jgi:RNA polymerase sigma-70 factor (ECF subfamily)
MSQPANDRSAAAVLDEYLVVRSQLGDPEAFRCLVRRWHAKLLRHGRHFTRDSEAAEDVVQESWIAIVRGLGSLHDPARFRAWAFRIVANKGRDWVRREEARRRATRGIEAEASASEDDPASILIGKVRRKIAELEPTHRRILTWFYLEEMSVTEIAGVLDVPAGTVKSRLFYARQTLITSLKET